MNKLKIYKVLFIILIIAIIVIATLVGIKYFNRYKNEQVVEETINKIKETVANNNDLTEEIDAEIGGYKVVRNNKNSKNKYRISNIRRNKCRKFKLIYN